MPFSAAILIPDFNVNLLLTFSRFYRGNIFLIYIAGRDPLFLYTIGGDRLTAQSLMAKRYCVQPRKRFNDLPHFFRRLSSSAPPFTSAAQQAFFAGESEVPVKPIAHVPVINLKNTKELFSSVSTTKLVKSTITLTLASMDRMVGLGTRVMNSKLVENPITKRMVMESIRHTFYEHFCGGKDLKEADGTIKKLSDSGLKAMLDYGLEHAGDNVSCDRNLREFVRTIEAAKAPISDCPISFVVIKITAICTPSLLKRVSDLLRWEYKDESLNLPWKRETLPIFSDMSPFYHTQTRPNPLTVEEELDLELAYNRLIKICEDSLDADVPLLIDAEDTSIQPAIDYLAYSAATKYQRDDGPLIFNTVQAYLKDAQQRLMIAKQAADERGVQLGFKLVRGAYMSSERELAASLGVSSPIHNSIEKTHSCFNKCTNFMLEEIARGSGAIVLATHNVDSGQKAAAKAVNMGIKKDSPKLHFAQLYGMAEPLSFGLRNAGFKVSKYLPFGPVEQIIPYLLRRAEENKGLLATSASDRTLMRKELLRRLNS